jgi:SHS2 domain-containing protein
MKRYALIDHTADIRLYVEASTIQELFQGALEGMSQIIAPHTCKQQYTNHTPVAITSSDTTTLLIDFLSEVLTQTAITKMIFCSVKITRLTPTAITGTLHGHSVAGGQKDIKAVTYHEAEVKKNENNNYDTTIVFDM